jgi:hypothetical protein
MVSWSNHSGVFGIAFRQAQGERRIEEFFIAK